MQRAGSLSALADTFGRRMAPSPVLAWSLLALACIAFQFLAKADLGGFLGDTDDATRLVEVRELMAGASWFDVVLPRFNPPDGLASHWSRLIDLPLALLISLFATVMTPASAELATRALWPLIMLLAMLYVLARSAEIAGGRAAAAIALMLAATCSTALGQFNVGRIDHHNAQILGAVGGVLLLFVLPRAPQLALAAGALSGFSVAVGYEGLPLVLLGAGLAALWGVIDTAVRRAVLSYSVALAGTVAAAFIATTRPAAWSQIHCDALSGNLVVLIGVGVAGLAAVLTRGGSWPVPYRLLALATAGAAGIASYGALEPQCLLHGPFGQVPAELKTAWLDQILETRSLFSQFSMAPAQTLGELAFFLVGICAQLRRWWLRRDPADLILALILVFAVALGCWQIKFAPYASWLACLPVALTIAGFTGTMRVPARTGWLAGILLANQSTLSVLALAVEALPAAPADAKAQLAQEISCMATAASRALNHAPKGLVIADTDLGPFIVATTGHSVLSAPYHRIPNAILATQRLFAGSAAEALPQLTRMHADYVAFCPDKLVSGLSEDGEEASLYAHLKRGEIPGYLSRVALPEATPIQLYRIRH